MDRLISFDILAPVHPGCPRILVIKQGCAVS